MHPPIRWVLAFALHVLFAGLALGDDQPKPATKIDQYGDKLPDGAVARLGPLRFRHDGVFHGGMAFTPDGKGLVANATSGVHIWDPATGKERLRIPVPQQIGLFETVGLCVSPDGITLAICEPHWVNGLVKSKVSLWDLRNGKLMRVLPLPKGEERKVGIIKMCFAPDGKSLAMSHIDGGKAFLFDLKSDTIRAYFAEPGFHVFHLAFSPDGNILAGSLFSPSSTNPGNADNKVVLWNSATGKVVRIIRDRRQDGNIVGSMALSPTGKILACTHNDSIQLFDPETAKEIRQLEVPAGGLVKGLAITPDDKKLLARQTTGVLVWDLQSGKLLRTLTTRVPRVESMALSPDGNTVALATKGTTIQVWDVATGRELFPVSGHDFPITSVACATDGKTVAYAGRSSLGKPPGPIVVVDAVKGARIGELPKNAQFLALSPNGKHLAAGELHHIQIWEVGSRKGGVFIDPETYLVQEGHFSEDGRALLTLDWNQSGQSFVRRWDVTTGRQTQMWTLPPERSLNSSLGADGKAVAANFGNGNMAVHQVQSKRSRSLHGQELEGKPIHVSPDGKTLASATWLVKDAEFRQVVSISGGVRLWEIATGKEIFHLKAHHGKVEAIAWSPDSRFVAAGDQKTENQVPPLPQAVRVWDTFTGKEVRTFANINADVSALKYAPDGASLIAGLGDGTVLVFDTSEAQLKTNTPGKLGKDELALCWTDLKDDNAAQARRAMGALMASAGDSVPFLRGQLKPAPAADAAKIGRWIADLDSAKFTVRQLAAKELEKVGEQVTSVIQKALKRDITLETRRRLEQILNALSDNPDPETMRTVRAIMVLERIGSLEAQRVLEGLAHGAPGACETEEAKASLERLKQPKRMP
jgi:WD40 repeat protein